MKSTSLAAVFPGQGAFFAGALAPLKKDYPQIEEIFDAIDAVVATHSSQRVSPAVLEPGGPTVDELLTDAPEVLQEAIFGVSVATYRVLAARGMRPDLLIGHSLGEISALVCAEAFTVAEGAEIVWQRTRALGESGSASGYMAALGLDAARSRHLLGLVDDPKAAVAVLNAPVQTVVSGPTAAMDVTGAVAQALGVSFRRLNAGHPFHSPLLADAAADFAQRIAGIEQKPLAVPVLSPISGRTYRDDDDLTAELATHFVRPVDFAGAIRAARAEGIQVFVECGALHSLSTLVSRVLADSSVVTVAPLQDGADQRAAFPGAWQQLAEAHALDDAAAQLGPEVQRALVPDASPDTFTGFWSAHGARITDLIRREFQASLQVAPAIPLRPEQPPTDSGPSRSRDQVLAELVSFYADALEYPPAVFGEDTDLEAELGIDSVKQTELLGRVSEIYSLPPRPPSFRFADHNTLGRIADLVLDSDVVHEAA